MNQSRLYSSKTYESNICEMFKNSSMSDYLDIHLSTLSSQTEYLFPLPTHRMYMSDSNVLEKIFTKQKEDIFVNKKKNNLQYLVESIN